MNFGDRIGVPDQVLNFLFIGVGGNAGLILEIFSSFTFSPKFPGHDNLYVG
jgi:hypothetical protein